MSRRTGTHGIRKHIALADNDDRADGRVKLSMMLTSAADRVQLLRCFRDAAIEANINLQIISVDETPEYSPACLLADAAYAVPAVSDEHYIDQLIELSVEHSIDLIVPGSMLELGKLSADAGLFAAIDTWVVVSGQHLVDIARNFRHMAKLVERAGAQVPRTGDFAEVASAPEAWTWPLIVRPEHYGDHPLGTMVLRKPAELVRVWPKAPVVLQQRPVGRRFVLQMLFGEAGNLLCAAPYQVMRNVAHGLELSIMRKEPAVLEFAERLARVMPDARGPVHCELVVTEAGALIVDALSSHLAPGYSLVDRSGAKIALWLLEQAAGSANEQSFDWIAGIKMLQYPAPLYIAPTPEVAPVRVAAATLKD